MNLLAHALLAYAFLPDTRGLETTGAIMADYFSGERTADYPDAMALGIAHHRRIDAFTDSHAAFASAREALGDGAPPHSGGILVDLFWDNVLASGWERFGEPLCGMGLADFTKAVYARMEEARPHWSPSFARAAPWIVSMDWLGSYALPENVERALRGLAFRLPHGAPLAECGRLLLVHRESLEEAFRRFWPEAIAFAREAGASAATPAPRPSRAARGSRSSPRRST